jgi:hypothetical protein
MSKRAGEPNDLARKVLAYMVQNCDGLERPMRLREYFLQCPSKAYDVRTALKALIVAGYIEWITVGDERLEDLEDDSEWVDDGALTMSNATLAVSLKREGLLHFAALEQGSAELRFTRWQMLAFWALFVMAIIQTLASLQQAKWLPFQH